jgi:hypothetical protein
MIPKPLLASICAIALLANGQHASSGAARSTSPSPSLSPSLSPSPSPALSPSQASKQTPRPSTPASGSRTNPTSSANAKPKPKPGGPKVERPVPFKPGETLAYDISWAAFMTAATATVTVQEKRPSYDSLAYYIVAEGQPTAFVSALYKLYYKADTLLDAYTLLPQRGSLYSREAGRQHLRATRFQQEAHTAHYEVQSGATLSAVDAREDLQIPAATQDAVSVIYALRAMDLKAGVPVVMPLSINGATYRVRIVAGPRETVSCGLGQVNAVRLTPSLVDAPADAESDAKNMAVWISDDSRRLPVLMQAEFAIGTFKLTLRSATAGS